MKHVDFKNNENAILKHIHDLMKQIDRGEFIAACIAKLKTLCVIEINNSEYILTEDGREDVRALDFEFEAERILTKINQNETHANNGFTY